MPLISADKLTEIVKEDIANDNVKQTLTSATYGEIKYFLSEAAKGIDFKCPGKVENGVRLKCEKTNEFKIEAIDKTPDRAMLYCSCGFKKNIQVEYLNTDIKEKITDGIK